MTKPLLRTILMISATGAFATLGGATSALAADAPVAGRADGVQETCTVVYDDTPYYDSSWRFLGTVDYGQNLNVSYRNGAWYYGTLWGLTFQTYVPKNRVACPV